MKNLICLLVLALNIHAHAAEYNPELPVWKQYDSLYCKYERIIKCHTSSAGCAAITEKRSLDLAFILDFKKKKMRYLGISNLEYPITSYKFHRKDNIYPIINNLTLEDSIVQIIYLRDNNNKFQIPRFEVTKIDFAYIDVESEAEVGTFFSINSICYANEMN